MAVVLGWMRERGRGASRREGKRPPCQEGGIETWTIWELLDFPVAPVVTVASALKLRLWLFYIVLLKMRAFLEVNPH